jgi:zinc protease
VTTTLHTLPNGLTVLLEENHAAPVISLNALVKVGSAMETAREAGISHFIEHMLFKGTPTRPVGQIAWDVEAAGGEINAYTTFDQTVYYINMASRYADAGLDILTDAVQHPIFDATETTRESEVICEEIRRGEDSPSHQLSEFVFQHTYGDHPYGCPIIGSHKTVKSFTNKDLRTFWKRWYTPDNIYFIVVGDFDTQEYLAKITKAFAKMPKRRAPNPRYINQQVQTHGPRAFHHRANIESGYFGLTVPVPSIQHADIPAIDLLSHILGGSDSSRLERSVKEDRQLVQSIYSYAYTPRSQGLFLIGGRAKASNMEAILDCIQEEIAMLLNEGIAAAELARAKLNIISSATYERESVGGLAGKYAYMLATAEDHLFEEKYFPAIQQTSAEDILAVCRRYLTPDASTFTWVAPKKAKLPTTRTIVSHLRRPKKTAHTPGPRATSGPTQFRLKNGLRVVVRPNHGLPLLACRLFMMGGTRYETKATNGINALLAQTLTKSTRNRSAQMLAESIDGIAGDIGASPGANTFGICAEFLSEKVTEGIALMSDVINAPAFAGNEVKKEQHLLLEAIRNRKDNLAATAMLNFCRALYQRHPYSFSRIGERTSVQKLTPKTLRLLDPKRAVLSFAGDISVSAARDLAEEYFLPAFAHRSAPPKVPALQRVAPKIIETVRKDRQQAHIIYGMRAITVSSPDRYAFAVMNQILAGQGGRLFMTLRDKMSLAYAVSASHQLGIEAGFFTVYIGTEPGKISKAIGGIETELDHLSTTLVATDELRRARQHLTGTYELDLQRNASVATLHALNVLYGLGLDEERRYPEKILKVTRQDVLRVAKKYLRREQAICSIVRP